MECNLGEQGWLQHATRDPCRPCLALTALSGTLQSRTRQPCEPCLLKRLSRLTERKVEKWTGTTLARLGTPNLRVVHGAGMHFHVHAHKGWGHSTTCWTVPFLLHQALESDGWSDQHLPRETPAALEIDLEKLLYCSEASELQGYRVLNCFLKTLIETTPALRQAQDQEVPLGRDRTTRHSRRASPAARSLTMAKHEASPSQANRVGSRFAGTIVQHHPVSPYPTMAVNIHATRMDLYVIETLSFGLI